MNQVSILRILPLLAIVSPLAMGTITAAESSQSSLITLDDRYTGTLTPTPANPQGEVCYQLAVKPNTRVTIKAKTSGMGILKFAVYDKTKTLQFLHNTTHNKSSRQSDVADNAGFNFPITGAGSQLCLSTNNPQEGQKYEFTMTGKPNRGIRVRQPLPPNSPVASKLVASTSSGMDIPPPPPTIEPTAAPTVKIPPPPTIEPTAAPTVKILPPPTIEPTVAPTVKILPPPTIEPTAAPTVKISAPPIVAVRPPAAATLTTPVVSAAPATKTYCYAGTWQISDLSAYWLPFVQNFSQAKVANPRMIGYAKITIAQDGRSLFEAFDLEQKYTLNSKETGAKIDNLEFILGGRATARFQANPDNSLTFHSQNYRRLTSKVNLGQGIELEGNRLFTVFGDRNSPQIPVTYNCVDRDNLILNLPLPVGKKLIPIALKRIN
jgi:hypothetical protein